MAAGLPAPEPGPRDASPDLPNPDLPNPDLPNPDLLLRRQDDPVTGESVWGVRLAPAALRRLLLAVVAAVLLLQAAAWTIVRLRDLLLIVLVAWLLALAIEPVIAWCGRRGLRRGPAAALILLSGVAALAGFLALFGQLLVRQIVALVNALPEAVRTIVEWANGTLGTELTLDQGLTGLADQIGLLDLSSEQTSALVSGLLDGVTGALTGTLGVLLGVAAGGLFAFYLAADGPRLRMGLARLMPASQQRVLDTVWHIAAGKAGGYLISRLTLALIAATTSAVFFLILDIPFWLPLALFNGIVSQFIPTIGVYLGAALPVLIAVVENPWYGLFVIIFATAYQQVENYLLLPRISATTMAIHPAVALASALAGALLFGVVGAFIAIPVVAAVIAVLDTYAHRHELVAEISAGNALPNAP